jgi:hypothetical protein
VARCGYCGAIDLHSRLDAAKAALSYEKPRLQAVTLAKGGETACAYAATGPHTPRPAKPPDICSFIYLSICRIAAYARK